AGLQHFRNELRTARRAGMASLIAAVVPRATWPTALETRTARASAAIGMSTTTVWTASATTVTSAAAERPLEARTRIAADTPGVAWEILRVSRGTANARRTSFAREENHVVFDDRRDFRDGSSWSRGKHFLFGVLGLDVLVFDLFLFAVLVRAMSGVMFGVLLSHVRSEFGAIGGAAGFDFFGFFLGELRNFRDDGFLDFFGLLFVFFFVELRAADYGIGFRLFLRLFVFGLDETGGARGVISSTAGRSSCFSCSITGTGAGAATGLLRYFASDSPGRMISSSETLVTEGTELRGASTRRLS